MSHQPPPGQPQRHPVLGCVAGVEAAVKDVADVNPAFMSTADKQAALLGLSGVIDRLEELRLRILATAEDVADQHGARDAAAWLAHAGRRDRGHTRRQLRLAQRLDRRWAGLAQAMRDGAVNLAQAEVIVAALDALPDDLDPDIAAKAEARLVTEAADFGPRALRILGRRILDIVAPEVAEAHERRLLDQEEAAAATNTFLRVRRRGDGTTDIHLRVADISPTDY